MALSYSLPHSINSGFFFPSSAVPLCMDQTLVYYLPCSECSREHWLCSGIPPAFHAGIDSANHRQTVEVGVCGIPQMIWGFFQTCAKQYSPSLDHHPQTVNPFQVPYAPYVAQILHKSFHPASEER